MTWCMFPACDWDQYILALSLVLFGEVERLEHASKVQEFPLQPVCSPADAVPSLRKHSAGGYRKSSTSLCSNIFILNGI